MTVPLPWRDQSCIHSARNTPRPLSAVQLLICLMLPLAGGFALHIPVAAAGNTTPEAWVFGADNTLQLDPLRGLLIMPPGYTIENPFLVVEPEYPLVPKQHRRRNPKIFTRTLYEGIENGHRGLSQHADDDNDGRVDEDRADGIDNDGDGRIDEDFAAIGDRMQIMDISDPRGVQHVEVFNWTYPHLEEILFVKWQGSSHRKDIGFEGRPGTLLLNVEDSSWRELNLNTAVVPSTVEPDHTKDAVIHIAPFSSPNGWRWLGIAVLDNKGNRSTGTSLENGTLRISHGGDLSFAVIITETLEAMCYRFRTAMATFVGASPEPRAPAIPWLVPPLRDLQDYPDPPGVVFSTDKGEALVISLDIEKGWQWLPDPGRISIDGRRLGSPNHISWYPDDRSEVLKVDWKPIPPDQDHRLLELDQIYPGQAEITSGTAEGKLVFGFDTVAFDQSAERLEFESLCGQRISLEARIQLKEESIDSPEATIFETLEESSPTLSRDLLEVFPNPFRDMVLLRFTVPHSIKDGFSWNKDRPPLLDPDAPIPYSSDSPPVSLRIYSLAGHEVASLFEGLCGVGQYNTSWNGISDTGRLMATGTYFCKLQIDEWSATRRIVLLR